MTGGRSHRSGEEIDFQRSGGVRFAWFPPSSMHFGGQVRFLNGGAKKKAIKEFEFGFGLLGGFYMAERG